MRALVTGGAGFVGSHVCDLLLAEGHEVVALDDLSSGSLENLAGAARSPRFSFELADVREPTLEARIAAIRPEVVLHLAAQASVAVSVGAPVTDAFTNVLGTVRVLDASRRVGVGRVVFAASGGTLYGDVAHEDLPVAEDHPRAPSSPYGISKRVGVEYLEAFARLYGLHYVALALANVYGPRQDPFGEAGVTAIFAANALAARPSTIEGDGDQTRDFVYVGDVARAFVLATAAGEDVLVNIGTGTRTSVNELHAAIAAAVPTSPPARRGPAREGDVRDSALDAARAAAVLGWRAETVLSEGIAATIEHLRATSA